MPRLSRFEVHPGNRPGQRKVYARLDTGELRRVGAEQSRALLLQYDINEANKGFKAMRYVRANRIKFLLFAIAAVIVVALTLHFPSF